MLVAQNGSRSQCNTPIQKANPAIQIARNGFRPAKSARRISKSHGTGAIHASGQKSSGGNAAYINRVPAIAQANVVRYHAACGGGMTAAASDAAERAG